MPPYVGIGGPGTKVEKQISGIAPVGEHLLFKVSVFFHVIHSPQSRRDRAHSIIFIRETETLKPSLKVLSDLIELQSWNCDCFFPPLFPGLDYFRIKCLE